MKRYALYILLALNGGLALLLAWLWIGADGSLRDVHWKPPLPHTTDFAAMLPVVPGVASADTSQFIAMLDRPLFSATRKPPPPPAPPQTAEEASVDNLSTARLSGLFTGDGTGGIIVQIAGKYRRARLNEAVDGWTLKSIQDRNVTFTKGGQSRILQLPRAAVTTYSGLAHAPASAQLPRPSGQRPAVAGNPGNTPQASGPGTQDAKAAPPPRATFGGSRSGS
ncbi:hypothetical protein [Diaphorobacter nitroreducens]|uniref:hypothetical protein n=1 Tax=Diaphorobacter nitroreducens TaxID=164759 RepID=UPI0028A2AAE1|nr:hypothetical protein [Diaphorobacter nitroreducens]